MKVLEAKNLSTKIGNHTLISNISFHLHPGSIMALVGHNGAGKSTLIKIIVGILEKTEGQLIINENHDQDKSFLTFKQLISYLPEEPLLLTELTVMQHFQLYGMSYGIPQNELSLRVDRYVAGFELSDKLNEYPESLSKGMRQKVQTICAFLPDTPVLLIDEPFMGLDVYAMAYLETIIQEKSQKGTSILLTTHQLDRVKDIADHFLMLQHGVMLKEGPITDFETIQRSSVE